VSLVALSLFEQRGFDAVTMDGVARAAKVSRRTLFRLFPSKSDLVWQGLDEVLAAARARVRRRPRSLEALVEELFVPTLRLLDDEVAAGFARRRLALIAAEPGVLRNRSFEALRDFLVDLVTPLTRRGGPPPALVAETLIAVSLSSVLWWAREGGASSAAEALRAGVSVLQASGGLREPRPRIRRRLSRSL
jgi:AcrR family transcriptional regulator